MSECENILKVILKYNKFIYRISIAKGAFKQIQIKEIDIERIHLIVMTTFR